jgi:hypothetical protein
MHKVLVTARQWSATNTREPLNLTKLVAYEDINDTEIEKRHLCIKHELRQAVRPSFYQDRQDAEANKGNSKIGIMEKLCCPFILPSSVHLCCLSKQQF